LVSAISTGFSRFWLKKPFLAEQAISGLKLFLAGRDFSLLKRFLDALLDEEM
jgi:hypothetical protein